MSIPIRSFLQPPKVSADIPAMEHGYLTQTPIESWLGIPEESAHQRNMENIAIIALDRDTRALNAGLRLQHRTMTIAIVTTAISLLSLVAVLATSTLSSSRDEVVRIELTENGNHVKSAIVK